MALRVALILDGNAQGAKVALQQTTAEVDKLTTATVQQTAAAQANVAANARAMQSNGNVANIAAQLQDVAITSAMGMSPLQIALQQGTQLSAVLGSQGAAGAARMLVGAFASLVNPVSLVTIGVVGLGAAALQALGNITSGAEKATVSLEEHDKWLKEILTGYESAAKAAKAASEASQQMPKGAVQSNLEKDLKDNLEKLDEAYQVVIARRAEFADFAASMAQSPEGFGVGPEVISQFTSLSDLLNKVTADGRLTRDEAGQLTTAFTQMKNVNADENLQGIAKAALDSVGSFAELQGVVDSLNASLAELHFQPAVAQFNRAMDATSAGIAKMKAMIPELRDSYQQAKDTLTDTLKTAETPLQRFAAQKQYEQLVSALDAQKAQQAAKKAASAGAKVDPFERAMGQTDKRAADLALEIALVGSSTFEIEKATKARELENAAKEAGIPLSAKVLADIDASADAYARNTVALTAAQEAFKTIQQVGVSSWDSIVDSALSGGKSITDVLRNIAAEYAKMALQMAIFNPIKNSLLGTDSPTFGSGIASFIAGLFGKREAGGPVVAGRPYIVGEKRPEIFVPTSSGTILPNTNVMAGAGGGGMRFTQTIVNNSREPVASRQRQRSDGTMYQELVIGATQRGMERDEFRQFGIRPATKSR